MHLGYGRARNYTSQHDHHISKPEDQSYIRLNNIMAISVEGESSDDKLLSPLNSDSSKNVKIKRHDNKSHFIKIDFASHRTFRSSKKTRKKIKSPYCAEDKVQLLSHLHEKRLMRRKDSDAANSSFPLAAQIYKASSDDLKQIKSCNRKPKKSILTLPNDASLSPQVCTVSDMNEAEYNRKDLARKQNCRAVYRRNMKPKHNERYFFDGGTQYYSKLKIDLDCSSSDIVKPSKRNRQKMLRKKLAPDKCGKCNGTDVWALLRNIDSFRLRQSPPTSDNSSEQKPRSNKHRNKQKEARLIETRTEEIAYISSYSLEDRSSISISPSSSCDRITVIDKHIDGDHLGNVKKLMSLQQSRDKKGNKYSLSGLNKKSNNLETELVNKVRPKLKEITKKNNEERSYTDQNGKQQGVTNSKSPNTGSVGSRCASPAVTNSSHREHNYQQNVSEDSPGVNMTSTESSRHVIKGITKVVLKENEKASQGDYDLPKRKSRLVTTMPSCNSPKLTLTDKRRILASHKFPISILNKDQVNPVRIANYEFSQFSGLEKHIWPFMIDWFDKDELKRYKVREQKKPTDSTFQKYDERKPNDINSYFTKNNFSNQCKNYSQIEQVKSFKCLNQIKDGMLKLMEKKSHTNLNSNMKDLAISSPESLRNVLRKQTNVALVDVGTNSKISNLSSKPISSKTLSEQIPPLVDQKTSSDKKPVAIVKPKINRTKQNGTNDFIENVITKVKNGIYFNQKDPISASTEKNLVQVTDIKNDNRISNKPEYNDSDISNESEISSDTGKSDELEESLLLTIPGFDDPLPALEVLTLADNRIEIKQCMTNITMQFDIDFYPLGFNHLHNNGTVVTSLLNSPEKNMPNILKYKRTILNAVLPAELCSIVPKMLRELSVSSTNVALSTVKINETQPRLSSIVDPCRQDIITAQPNMLISAGMKILIGGRYSRCPPSLVPAKRIMLNNYHDTSMYKILPNVDVDKMRLLIKVTLPQLLFLNEEKYQEPACSSKTNAFIDLNLKTNSLQIADYGDKFDFNSFIDKIMRSSSFTMNVSIQNFLNMYSVEISKTTDFSTDKLIIQVTINTFHRRISVSECVLNKPMINSQPQLNNKNRTNKQLKKLVSTKKRKISFCKLSRKCKSTSSIPEPNKCIPLDEINSLEEFCQVLGSGKILTNVFNGKEDIIMDCIKQLKTWISEISSSQAMLVLLLLNKKDSSNLTRLRPVILQAIAVKRITKATELDMEVEVIENEKFKRLSEYSQNTQKPATVTVTDPDDESLLEELCWIAKTTASDYQKVYDETSEKLLKLLINKRKKLNPSYLRVMARYVGLGLLKSPGKL